MPYLKLHKQIAVSRIVDKNVPIVQ